MGALHAAGDLHVSAPTGGESPPSIDDTTHAGSSVQSQQQVPRDSSDSTREEPVPLQQSGQCIVGTGRPMALSCIVA